jgi:hypothetical protein
MTEKRRKSSLVLKPRQPAHAFQSLHLIAIFSIHFFFPLSLSFTHHVLKSCSNFTAFLLPLTPSSPAPHTLSYIARQYGWIGTEKAAFAQRQVILFLFVFALSFRIEPSVLIVHQSLVDGYTTSQPSMPACHGSTRSQHFDITLQITKIGDTAKPRCYIHYSNSIC